MGQSSPGVRGSVTFVHPGNANARRGALTIQKISSTLQGCTYFTMTEQKPPMHLSDGSQQSASVVHFSSMWAHPIGGPHIPLTQKPPQQSIPLVQAIPSCLQ